MAVKTPEAEAPEIEPERLVTAQRLYRFSTWVHVGPGAEECEAINEEAGTNDCSDPLHFHAWCRMPNQFQHRAIREKALAAKARRVRQIRNVETDAGAVMEDELDTLARRGDGAKTEIVEELLAKDWYRDYMDAKEAVEIRDGDEDEPKWGHIVEDQERYMLLHVIPEEDRTKAEEEEHTELSDHITAYQDALNAELEEIVKPKREALESRDINGLIDLLRDHRIEAESTEVFMHVYAVEEWLACTSFDSRKAKPRFESQAALEAAAPEVVTAIKATFDDLERQSSEVGRGN